MSNKIGTKIPIALFSELVLNKLTAARRNPRKYDPLSPINNFAGKKLYLRKPKLQPEIEAAIIGSINWPFWKEIIVSPNPANPVTPAANPSNPSNQFIAFVIPTSQITVILELKILILEKVIRKIYHLSNLL